MAAKGLGMLTLRTSKTSPFGRKIRIAIGALGMEGMVHIQLADTMDPMDTLRIQNPLGKIPTLVLEDGSSIFDSPVILEYLNLRHGGDVLIPNGGDRLRVLQQQAVADGLLDAALLIVYEARFREKLQHSEAWLNHQREKIERTLAYTSLLYADDFRLPAHAGCIAQASALGYLDFRFSGAWRRSHPKLSDWLDEFSRTVPSYIETIPA